MLKINVPFSEKDEAKLLGALWNAQEKTWYIPRGKYANIRLFEKWMDMESDDIILACPIYIAESSIKCWKCKKEIKVITLACHKVFTSEVDEDEKDVLVEEDLGFTFLSNISKLPKELVEILQKQNENYKLSYTKTAQMAYFNNHCQGCNSVQGDFYLHEEPGGAFCPIDEEEIRKIKLTKLDLTFDQIISGGFSWSSNSDEVFRLARK